MREHDTPSCPEEDWEYEHEELETARVAIGIPITYMLEERQVLLIERNGGMHVQTQLVAVPMIGVTLSPPSATSIGYDDEEVPF